MDISYLGIQIRNMIESEQLEKIDKLLKYVT
jgi:hypothetical protein